MVRRATLQGTRRSERSRCATRRRETRRRRALRAGHHSHDRVSADAGIGRIGRQRRAGRRARSRARLVARTTPAFSGAPSQDSRRVRRRGGNRRGVQCAVRRRVLRSRRGARLVLSRRVQSGRHRQCRRRADRATVPRQPADLRVAHTGERAPRRGSPLSCARRGVWTRVGVVLTAVSHGELHGPTRAAPEVGVASRGGHGRRIDRPRVARTARRQRPPRNPGAESSADSPGTRCWRSRSAKSWRR